MELTYHFFSMQHLIYRIYSVVVIMFHGWLGSIVVGVGLVIKRSRVRLLVGAFPGSLGQLSLPSLWDR